MYVFNMHLLYNNHKALYTCFIYITRSKTNKKMIDNSSLDVLCSIYFPNEKVHKQLKPLLTPPCLASHIWDANYFRNFRQKLTFWSK